MLGAKNSKQLEIVASALIGSIIVAAAFWGWFAGFDRRGTLTTNQIRQIEASMYSAALPDVPFPFASPHDSLDAPTSSRLRLSENGHPLGPAHSPHATIGRSGGGAFSHWNGSLLFSTSDNSDPTTNGRAYEFAQRIFLTSWAALCLVLLGELLCWPAIADIGGKLKGKLKGNVRIGGAFAARQKTGRMALTYGLLLCIPALALFLIVGARNAPKSVAALGGYRALSDRVAAYLENPSAYSVVFLGDSRTYCGVHPELIEPLVPGMRGINLSHFANWLPTQFALSREIADRIPPGTTVVWSIGHQNFFGLSSGDLAIQRVYPISLSDAVWISWWNAGTAPKGLLDSLYFYHWYLHSFIVARNVRGSLQQAFKRPFSDNRGPLIAMHATAALPAANTVKASYPDETARALEREASAEPDVVHAGSTTDDGRLTSIIRYFRRGGYHRTEIDPEYFRSKQAATGHKPVSEAEARTFKTDPPRQMEWNLFVAILDIFAAKKVRLVVNELEEAPYTYRHPMIRAKWREMMRTLVQPEVEQRGFRYIRTDLDQLSDFDYFDYNHMNSKGIAKYTPMLAQRLNELAAQR